MDRETSLRPDNGGSGPSSTVDNDGRNDPDQTSGDARVDRHYHDDGERTSPSSPPPMLPPLPRLEPPPPSSENFPPENHEPDTPLFWATSPTRPHNRTVSSVSYHSVSHLRPAAINLEDRSSEDTHETARSCWAQWVSVDEHVVVSGATGIGAYVVWHCTVRTLQGGDMSIRKRYSEFDQLRSNLVRAFPHAEAMIPPLPRKSVVSRFRPKFLEQRQAGLAHFLKYVTGFS